jgi:hypothetical protein
MTTASAQIMTFSVNGEINRESERLAEMERRRAEIDAEQDRVDNGDFEEFDEIPERPPFREKKAGKEKKSKKEKDRSSKPAGSSKPKKGKPEYQMNDEGNIVAVFA